jgi:hypothetical protein
MTIGLAMLSLKNGNIIIATDRNATRWYIRMNASDPADLRPAPMGAAVGHWAGDTLVIDTIFVVDDDPELRASVAASNPSAARNV